MRKIELAEPTSKIWDLWLKDCEAATAELHAAFGRQEPLIITELYKRQSIRKLYFCQAGAPFFQKCAYCDRLIPDIREIDIEHFRPKGGVTDEDGNPVFVPDDNGILVPHPGYFWLAYDWRNLLISCKRCNQPTAGKLGKKTRFPVSGKHARNPAEVAAEKPLLINPAEDDPDLHLRVDPKTGIMHSKTERGATCIDVFGFNVHTDLTDGRQEAARQARSLLVELIHGDDDDLATSSKLDAIIQGQKPFTMAAKAWLTKTKARVPQLQTV